MGADGEPYLGGLKQAFKHEGQCCAISRQPTLAQLRGKKARSAVRISLTSHAVLLMPLRSHTSHEMHPRGLKESEKSPCKSRPVSNAWYVSLDNA